MVAHRRGTIFVAAVGAVLVFLDVTIVNIAFPDIHRSFPTADLGDLSWIFNAYNIVFAALLIPSGVFAERFGQRQVFLLGLSIFTVSSLGCAVANTVYLLVTMRTFQAVGGALLIPTSLALMMNLFPLERRSTAVGVWGAVAAIGVTSGPSLGGLLIELTDWRSVFIVNIPIGIAILSYAAVVLPRNPPNRTQRIDYLAVITVMAAMSLLTLGIVKGPDWGGLSPPTVTSFALAAATGLLFLRQLTRSKNPLLDRKVTADRQFILANTAQLIFALGFYALLLCNVLFLTDVWHYSVLTAGLALTPAPLITILIAVPAGKVADRRGHRWVILPGIAFFIAGVALLIQGTTRTPDYLTQWLPAAIFSGIGVGLAFPALGSAAVARLPSRLFATGSSVSSAYRQTGAVLGVSILVVVLSSTTALTKASFDHGWLISVVAALTAGLLALGIRRFNPEL